MNILFLTLVGNDDISERGIYNDLMRKFQNEGHSVFIVSPYERRLKQTTKIIEKYSIKLLKVKTLNIQKTNILEKGLSTLTIEHIFLKAIKKYFSNIRFDLLIYSTPPITFTKIIKYIKMQHGAKTYLLLKDIFPQNAIDIGLMKEGSFLHKYFRKKERLLYSLSDYIGCMSPANVEYLIKHNPNLETKKIEVNPNSTEPVLNELSIEEIQSIRNKLGIPEDAIFFLYGGNLGLPQGIDFLIEVLNNFKNNSNVYFVIIGSGTMYPKIKKWIEVTNPENTKLIPSLPKDEYDKIVACSDVGMIFLDKRFTIPNFPSRLLTYMEVKKPVLLATDVNTDIGEIATDNEFGLWAKSGDLARFNHNLLKLVKNKDEINRLGKNGYNYYIDNYTSVNSYNIIMSHFSNV